MEKRGRESTLYIRRGKRVFESFPVLFVDIALPFIWPSDSLDCNGLLIWIYCVLENLPLARDFSRRLNESLANRTGKARF